MPHARALLAACLIGAAVLGTAVHAQSPPAEPPPTPLPAPTPLPQLPARSPDATPPTAPQPSFLNRPLETPPPQPEALLTPDVPPFLQTPVDPPSGFAGPSGILPSAVQESNHFVPMEDRWRIGFPEWDRYGNGHPLLDDYPNVEGSPWDSYTQNVLKGDYPIIGDHIFLNVTASSLSLVEYHEVPTPAHTFESTARPFELDFFGLPGQFLYEQYLSLAVDLFQGDAAFKPDDWRLHVLPVFNFNYLAVDELGIVNPNVLKGTDRARSWFTLEEYFFETKIADSSPYYDFLSVRVGSQPFTSDFRGFIFSDVNRAVRIFGTRLSDQDEFNLAYFRQAEKNTDSELNTFDDRGQDIFIANYYHRDFIWPGYNIEFSLHYNHDDPDDPFHYDQNSVLVRPDPVGVPRPHELNVGYLGFAGDGHIGPINIDHAFYWAVGDDSFNPMAGQREEISAEMAALELSYDRDWVRFRGSLFWASGDSNPLNHHATGFDSILDDPNFAGGQFSYWQSQAVPLLGVNLTNRGSLLPDLRSSKIEGQSNFVNPGLRLINAGVDFELTPKLRMINNVNALWFDKTEVLEQFVYQPYIHHFIGIDPSMGFEYRPFLNNNVITKFGVSALLPGEGFRDIYDKLDTRVDTMMAAFLQLELNF